METGLKVPFFPSPSEAIATRIYAQLHLWQSSKFIIVAIIQSHCQNPEKHFHHHQVRKLWKNLAKSDLLTSASYDFKNPNKCKVSFNYYQFERSFKLNFVDYNFLCLDVWMSLCSEIALWNSILETVKLTEFLNTNWSKVQYWAKFHEKCLKYVRDIKFWVV